MHVKIKSLLDVLSDQLQFYPNGDIAQSVLIMFLVENVETITQDISSETIELKYFDKDNLPIIFNEQHKKVISNFYQGNFPFYD